MAKVTVTWVDSDFWFVTLRLALVFGLVLGVGFGAGFVATARLFNVFGL